MLEGRNKVIQNTSYWTFQPQDTDQKDHILVIDGDETNHVTAKKLLGNQYRLSCVSSGKAAIDFLKSTVPDLILLDMYMPDLNGLKILDIIHTIEPVKHVPVIFLTTDTNQETELAIFRAGAMDYIRKPFISEVLLRRISRILELYHFQDALQKEVDKKTAELRESNRKIRNLSTQVMITLANTIDAKDNYTKGHSVRVANYSCEIARRMGKSPQEMENIYYIGLLHDIGKIGIPDEIIGKSASLSHREYMIMKEHPTIGAEILKDMTEVPFASIGAHWHHERYDGTGYPDGLKGTEIPELARIIGIADAYDAMTSKRSYRDVLPQEIARQEIDQGRGIQFDPAIAEIMLAMIDEDTEYKMREV